MGIFSQTRLLLWKNIILRYRHPGVLLLEVAWPVLIVGIIAVMRLAVPPTKFGNCHYHPRAMPSAGAIPFLQTYLCNLDNPCYRSEQKLRSAQTSTQQFSAMTQDLGPLLSSESVLDVLAMSNKTANVYTMIRKAVGNEELLHGLADVMKVGTYFRDPEKVKSILVDDYKLMSKDEATALLNSSLNVGNLFNLTGAPDFKEIACDSVKLSSFVNFPKDSDIKVISSSLCNITGDQTTGLANLMIEQLNFTTILNSIKLVEELKEMFLDDYYPLSYAFEIVAQMFEIITDSDQVMMLLGNFAGVPDIAKFIRQIPEFVKGFQDLSSLTDVLKDIVSNLEPVLKSLSEENSPIWLTIKDGVEMSENFALLIEGKWNGTSEEFVEPMNNLVKHVKQMAQDQDGQQFIAVFEFLAKIDWLSAYDEIIYTQTLSEKTVKHLLQSMQTMFEDMSVWHLYKDFVRINEHFLDVMSILTEKSIELRHALKKLFDSNDVLKNEINRIFAYGPSIIQTILEAFTRSNIFGDISNGASYQDVCRKALLTLQDKVAADVYNDVKNTLCSDAGDVSGILANTFESLKLSEIAAVINTTVQEFERLYKGEFFHDNVQLVDMYQKYVRFTTALNNYLYDDYKWMEIFKQLSMDDIDLNEQGWEPVTDMLDENFLTTLVLGSFQSVGKAFVSSPLAGEFAPTIHVMSEMVKMVYETMTDINTILSKESPLMKAANMFTRYMPEVIDGMSYMMEKNHSAISNLISAKDPLKTFCEEKYMQNMGMPAYVPLNEMNALICDTDWDIVIANMTEPSQRIETMVTKMVELMEMQPNTPYDIEADWIQLEDYAERLFDMISRGQILGVIDMRTTTVKFFDQLDFSRMEEGMNSLDKLMNNMMTTNSFIAVELVSRIISSFDNDVGMNSLSHQLNVALTLVDISMDLQLKSIKQQQNVTSMMGIINMFPPKMRAMITLLAKAYPQFVSSVADLMYNPQKLTSQILGSKAPDCNTTFVSDILMLSRDSSFHHFESFLCNLNWTVLFNELMESQTSSYTNSIERMINVFNTSSEISVDLKSLATKFDEYNRLIMANVTGPSHFDLSPFNLTAIDMSWERFYKAMDAIEKLDMQQIQKILDDVQKISLSMVDVNDTGLGMLLYSSLYINTQISHMLLDELTFFNSSEVILFDFLGLDELNKLKLFLKASPDINAVGVATISRLISDPQKAEIATDFEALCTNLTLFSKVFVVKASPKDPAEIQKTICEVINNINITLVMEQLWNRPSIKRLQNAMDALSKNDLDTVKKGVEGAADISEKISQLITNLAMNPPVIKLTSNDSVWMDIDTYAKEWEQLGKQLSETEQNQSWETMVSDEIVTILKSLPVSLNAFAYVDAYVDFMQIQLDDASGDFFEKYKKYPNTRIVVELMDNATDAIQTVLYTVFTQTEKVGAWTNALQSWESFCQTPAEKIFTVPPELKFNMADFKKQMCSIDDEELLMEFSQSEEIERIEALYNNNTHIKPNATEVGRKLNHLLESFSKQTTSFDSLENSFNLRLFNDSVWEDMFEHIESWLNGTLSNNMSPEKIPEIVVKSLRQSLEGLSPNVTEIFDKAFAVAGVVMDELLAISNSGSLDEAFLQVPSMKPFIYLLNSLPDFFENFLFTGTFHPELISMKLDGVESFEDFCASNPEEIFSQAPKTSFDAKRWTDMLCSINMTVLNQLMQYKTVRQIDDIVNNALSKPVNLTAVIKKTEKLINSLQKGLHMTGRVFDPKVWENIIEKIDTWRGLLGTDEQIFSQIQRSFTVGIIQFLQNDPENAKALHYIDAILDIVGQRVENSKVNLKKTFKDFPTIDTLMQLIDEAPEQIEAVLYTVFTQPEKTAAWSSAMQSWSAFCSTPASDIMIAPPSSKHNVSAWLAKMCTIDIDQLVKELNTYQGSERIKQIGMGNDTEALDVTQVIKKMNNFFDSLEGLVTNPMETGDLELRLFNVSMWEKISREVEQWLGSSSSLYGSDMNIADIINAVYKSTLSQIPEAQDVFSKVLAITNLITDQLMDLVETGSVKVMLGNSTSFQEVVKLANNIPELFEVLIYTSQKNPEKLSSATNSFMSLETLCASSPEAFFTIPPGLDFDLKGWFSQLCSWNVTQVESELVRSKTALDLESILYGNSSANTNVTSVITKIGNLMKRFENDIKFNDRFLNESVWSQVMSNVAKWMNDSSLLNDNLLGSVSQIFNIIEQLQSDPAVKKQLRPLSAFMAVMDRMIDNILALENRTEVYGQDLFAGWQGMQRMLTFIQTPDVLDILLTSSSTEKFMSLFSEKGLKDFCSSSTDPSKYLTSPMGKNAALEKVKSAFCDIDFDSFTDGFNSFIDIETIEKVTNGSIDFDWKAFQKKTDQFINLISKWEKQPPSFELPPQWMNESYWQNLLDSELTSLPEKLTAKNQVASIINQLGPLLDTEGLKQFGMILNNVMDIINRNIQSMQGAQYTLGKSIESIPALKNIFDALGVGSETLRSVALSPVRNFTLFAQLFISDDVQNDFCNTDKWEKAIDFPDNFNTSGLFQAVCQNNVQSLLDKWKDNFNLTNTLESLMDNSSHVQDWTEASSKIFALIDNIELLKKNPPMLNADETLSILSENYNLTSLFKLSEAFSTLQLMIFDSSGPFDTMGTSDAIKEVENVVGMVIGILDTIFARIKLQNGRLDITAVFEDVPEVQNIIKGILDIKPDPLTGLFAVALKADKINDFVSWSSNPSKLKNLFCRKTTFEHVFQIRDDVDVDGLLKALCTIDFESVANKLENSFLPDSMAKKGFDTTTFSKGIENILTQITNLTMIERIMFNDTDLGKLLMVNSSRLMEELEFNTLGKTVPEDYVALTTQILNSVLTEMHINNASDVKTLATSLRFIVAYLESFNSFLRSVKDQPIHLSMLLNNTEVGAILKPILTDPSILNGIVDIEVDIRKMSQLLEGPSPQSALCGPELFEALHVPSDENQAFQNLQLRICSANKAVILWQTVMLQANGYLLYKQMDIIEKEIQQGKQSMNTSAIAKNMQESISLMQAIIGQYVDGSKKFTDILDIDRVKKVLEQTQTNIAQKLMEASKSWSVDLAEIILPKVLDQAALQDMSKALSTANLFMNVTIAQLKGMDDGSVDVSDFFMRADGLQNLINAYIRLGTNIAPAWSNQEFDTDKMLKLFKNPEKASNLCQQNGGIAQNIASSSFPSQAVQDFSTVVCSVMGAAMSDDVKNVIGYNELGEMLISIWEDPQAVPHYSVFVSNVESFTQIIQQLASKTYTINSSILETLSLQSMVDSLENIGQNPQIIFRLLKLLGLGIDIPLGQDSEAVKSLSQMNSFVLMPMIQLLEAMKDKGITLTNIADSPDAFVDLMSVLVDFDVHFSVIKEFAIKPQINTLNKNRDAWCSSQPYRDMVHERLLTMNLPVTSKDILSMICSENPSKWIEKFEEMGLTNIQMEVVLDKMMLHADLYGMYDDQFKWIDLMSSMEKLSSLISESGVKSQSDMANIQSAWSTTKDLLFEKGFRSLFSYLELIESSTTPMDTEWAVFKQFLKFASSVMETINRNMKGFASKQTVLLEDVLPDSKHLADLMTTMIGSQNAAEFLTTSMDPIMFYKLSLYDTWKEICDGNDDIRNYFIFPAGTAVEALKNSLCQAVIARSSAFEEFLSLFGAKDMFKQLDMLIQGKWNDSQAISVYDQTHAAMMQLIKNLEDVQHALINADSVEGYFQPILNALSSMQSSQSVGLCNAMTLYLNKTQEYEYFHSIFSRVFSAFNLASNLAKIVPDLDDLACSLNNNAEINLKGFIQKLDNLGIMTSVEKAIEEFVMPLSGLKCSTPVTFSETLMEVINSTMLSDDLDLDRLNSCMKDTSVEFRSIISSASNLVDFMKTLVGVLQTPSIQKLINDPELVSTFNFIMHAIDANTETILKFEDLIKHDADVSSYLTDILKIPKPVVNTVLNATINQDWKNFFSESIEVISNIFCNPSRLSEILSLPDDSGVNVTEISKMLCTNEITDTVMYLKNVSASSQEIEKQQQGNDFTKVVIDLTEGFADLITNFNDVIQLFVDLASGYDIDLFRSNVKMIDEIIQGEVMNEFGNSLKKIMNGVKVFLSQDKDTQEVVHDVDKIIDGIIAIDIIKKPVIDLLKIKDLVIDVDTLEAYITHKLNFSQETVDSILQSTFSSRVFLGLEDKPVYTCDEVFQMILIMNGTGKKPEDISQDFCELNDEELKGLVNALKMELDIGDMISRYVSYTKDSILATTQMTKEELNDMVVNIDKSQAVIQEATDVFKKTPNGTQLLDVFAEANADAFTSINKMTPLMCGSEVKELFNTGFTSGLVLSSSADLTEDIQRGIDHNVDDLPNEFCKQIYENIRESEIGSILWAYVKPIMRGKIVYTPDNEVTRAILRKANNTFTTLEDVYKVASMWAKEAPNLMGMTAAANETDELRDALENDFIKGLLEATVGVSATSVLTGLDALESNNFDRDDLTALQTVAEIVANFTSCVELDRFVPVESEKDLEMEAYRLHKDKNFWAGIVFMNSEEQSQGRKKRQADPTIPKHVSYKIRMDLDNVMDTTKLKSGMYKMSAEDNFVEDMRYLRGFVYIQDILDNAIIDFHKNPLQKTPGLRIRQMPFPCHHNDSFIFMLGSYLIPVMMTFVFLAALGTATHTLVYDKENGQEQNLKVMGMRSGVNFVSWFITTMVLMTFVCAILSVMIKYTDIFIYSDTFIVFLMLLTFCFSSVMLLYMVSSFFTRTTLAILFVLMVYLISYLPYILVVSLELTMEYWQKNLACLASTTAFCFGAHSLGYLEESGTGVHWSNIKTESSKDFSVHWSCMMMLIDSAVYFIIGWYVRQIKPGKYGVSQPWYFPLSPLYWCSCLRGKGNKYLAPKEVEDSKGSLFESAPPGYEVGIEISNLSKSYGKKRVLQDLNINFYEGQISCLLGHNGAAKTTTLNMLCGVLEPSSGSVRINGKKPTPGKHRLGVCPQQNALFEYMSVLEHMEFYAGVKGARLGIQTMTEIKKLLKDVDLWHVKNVPARELSYGMKRRLCVALAFVGGSKAVVLDEPTSGVDPHARKNIWNLISSNRQGRTILMSTHHLDEADILSDRIAILHKGKLLCCGSATFLKRQLGGGFKLMVAKSDQIQSGAQPDSGVTNARILSYIQTICPGARITEQKGSELIIELPKDESQMNVPFPVFFQELDHKAKDIGILNYGLTDTTIEDIFLKMTLEMDEANDEGKQGILNPGMILESETTVTLPDDLTKSTDTGKNNPNTTSEKALFKPGARIHHDLSFQQGSFLEPEQSVSTKNKNTGASLIWSQVRALLIKRFHHYRRNWRILLTCVLFPLLSFLIALGFSTVRPDEGDNRPLVLDPVMYGKGTYTFLKQNAKSSSEGERIGLSFRNSSIGIGTSCMENIDQSNRVVKPSCKTGSAPYDIEKPLYIIGCKDAKQDYHEIEGQKMIVEEQDLPNNLYLQNLDNYNIPNYILRTFKDYKDKRFGGWSVEQTIEDNNEEELTPYAWFNSKGYHAMPSFLNGLSNSILRANLPFYKDSDEYGITTINHPIKLGNSPLTLKTLENDAADAGISILIVLAFSFIPCGFILYIINERIQKQKQLQQISGVGTFMYWVVSWLWDMFIYLIAVGIAVGIVCIFETDSFYMKDNLSAFAVLLILYGWAIIPYLYFVSRFFKNASTAYLVTFCINLFLALATVVALLVMQLFRDDDVIWRCYKVCRYLFLIFPQFALGQGLMDMVSSTVKYKLFLRFDEDFYDDPYSLDITGWKMIAMAIFGFVFFIITLISEAIHAAALSVSDKHSDSVSIADEDVIKEKERIQNGSNADLLQINDLSKVYRRGWKKFSAVDHISFGVTEGESFGLLGVNGAGKTTTFRMLTGDLGSSGGTVTFNGRKISSHERHFGQSVGYCPQEGGLDEYLTANETLHFHARLKGFDKDQSTVLVEKLLTQLSLKPYANKAVHSYSGGTKKKLALAVALLGDPPILYLDEPTTGMDAGTRRQAWKCIAQANRNGQSVILTSHTMDECDALCSRIAIMVNGQIKCIGSPQHLKTKFGDGYTAIVHSMKNNIGEISHFFLYHFPRAAIRTKHFSSLEIMIPQSCGHISEILSVLQRAQDEDMIEYYSVSQTTLDSVFISFAQEQTDSFEEGTVTNSSSIEDKSLTPRSSVSSERPPSYDGQSQSKKDSPYIFTNPQYVVTEDETEDDDANSRPRYLTNIAIGAGLTKEADKSVNVRL